MLIHKIKLASTLTSLKLCRLFSHISHNEKKGIKLFEQYYKSQKLVSSEEWESFIKCLETKLPLTIRINKDPYNHYILLKSFLHQNLKHKWLKDDKKFKIIEWYPDELAIQIKEEDTRSKGLQFFLSTEKKCGGIFIQETVSMIPVLLLDIEPHHHVLDLCAAPGAKATQLLQMFTSIDLKRKGFLIANDLKNKRNRTLVLQSKKFNFCSFAITKCDALRFPVLFDNEDEFKFDRILCDVTCSGDGTARKNGLSDWEADYCNSFHEKQLQIARRGLKLLKKGGIMVYSTCSFNPVENEAVVAKIVEESKGSLELIDLHVKLKGLKANKGLINWEVKTTKQLCLDKQVNQDDKVAIRDTMFPPKNISLLNIDRCLRILPHHQDTGAFFVAALKKKHDLPLSFQSLRPKFPSISKMPSINFINEDDREWQIIKLYYGLKDFPYSQLIYREESNKVKENKAQQNLYITENCNFPSTQNSKLTKRNIFFVNESLKKFIINNFFNLNYFHVGLKVFVRINKTFCDTEFRLSQEGLPIILPYLSSERIVEISKDHLRWIMLGEQSKVRELSGRLGRGCFVLNCKHSIGDNNVNIPFAVLVNNEILPLLHFNEKIHILRVAGLTK